MHMTFHIEKPKIEEDLGNNKNTVNGGRHHTKQQRSHIIISLLPPTTTMTSTTTDNTTTSPPLSSSQQQQDAIAASLAQDRPTIDAAVKSFLSLYAARSLTRDDCDTQAEALTQARVLLKTINQFTFPLLPEPSPQYSVTAQVWNGLYASNQKPSKFLGRTALKLAWQHGLDEELPERDSLFIQEFASLLLLSSYKPEDTSTPPTDDRDACLVWDADQGAAELARRRSRRQERAKEANNQEEEKLSLTIEELPNENDGQATTSKYTNND